MSAEMDKTFHVGPEYQVYVPALHRTGIAFEPSSFLRLCC